MYKDKQLVRITMFVLLVSIVLVYAVFFNIQGDKLYAEATNTLQKWMENSEEEQQNDTTTETETTGEVSAFTGSEDGVSKNNGITGSALVFSGLSELFGDDTSYLEGEVKMLSGTSLFQGSIDILKTLGINYEYVLKDGIYNIFYVYIGSNKNYNLRQIASEFG